MKAIINGRRYDTKTAVLIGQGRGRGDPRTDLGFWAAALYKTPRAGRYFLDGYGGFMTRWGPYADNVRNCGVGIFELEPDEALAWAEQYLKPHVIEKHFGDMA